MGGEGSNFAAHGRRRRLGRGEGDEPGQETNDDETSDGGDLECLFVQVTTPITEHLLQLEVTVLVEETAPAVA